MPDRSDVEDAAIDLDDFHEWVERTADAEGTSPEAVIQQLMSTYWILNELTETLEETPYEHLLQEDSETEPETPEAESDDEASTEAKSEIVDVIKAIAELNNQPDAPEPERTGNSIDPKLVDVIEALQRHSGSQQGAGPDATFSYVTNQLDRLRDDVSTLSRSVETVERRLDSVEDAADTDIDGVTERVDDVEETTEALESQLRSVANRHKQELTNLEETVDWLESALSGKADQDAVVALESRFEEKHEGTVERVDSVEGTFEDAYADIKQILGHLLDRSSEHTVMLDVLVDEYESDVVDLLDAHREAERLRDVKAAANRQGIVTAVCDACEETFDVAMLEEPRCPHCQREVDRFESESFLWRTKHIAKLRQQQPDRAGPSVRDRIEEAIETEDAAE